MGTKGEVVRVPGMPLMYDYEYYPQPVSLSICANLSTLIQFMLQSHVPPQMIIGVFARLYEYVPCVPSRV